MTKQKNKLISPEGFGAYLRYLRRSRGYTSPDMLIAALHEKTGYNMTKDALWRIERGRQEPTLTYLCALSLTLTGELLSHEILLGIEQNAQCK